MLGRQRPEQHHEGGRVDVERRERVAEVVAAPRRLLRVQAPSEGAAELEHALRRIEGVSVIVARAVDEPLAPDTRFLELEVVGQDHRGIVHGLTAALASSGVNVEELETEVVDAPMSGERLFQARARLQAPSSVSVEDLRVELERLAADLIVEVRLEEPRDG